MSTNPQSSSNTTATTAAKQPRSRKAANPDTVHSSAGRAGSAGGVVLETAGAAAPKKEAPQKLQPQPGSSAPKTAKPAAPSESLKAGALPLQQTKRKPRKLNKEPAAATPQAAVVKDGSGSGSGSGTGTGSSSEAAELEALKSRVRGLEAKVEELYRSSSSVGGGQTAAGATRSPRRRGKGRKSSSATTTATLGTLASARDRERVGEAQVVELNNDDDDDGDAADEELLRLEDELENARQDLALYRPGTTPQRPRTRRSGTNEDAEDVEEIPRDGPAAPESRPRGGMDRQVTLSGSYRIPLPATLDPEDVKTIQSGVAAAQNVARSFLDHRRANAGNVRGAAAQGDGGAPSSAAGKREGKAKASSAREGAGVPDAGGKQSWGEWIGGYSMAISRAVKNIEHEAAMEAQRAGQAAGGKREKAGAAGGARRKRPGPKTTLSGEQIEGLMG